MRRAVLAFLALLCVCSLAHAQIDATRWTSGTVDIDQGWKQHDGDNPRWAQPSFDDSQWPTVDLDDMGASQPGWHWFRLHVRLAPGHPHLHLLFAGGDGVYQLYINGQKADGPRLLPFYELSRPTEQVIPVPDDASDLELALRTHAPITYRIYHLPLFLTAALGTPGAIDNERASMQSVRLYSAIPSTAINLLLILAGIAALALYRAQRGHPEYRWLGLYLLLLGISNALAYNAQAGTIPLEWNDLIGDPLIYAFTILQIEFTFSFAGQRVGRAWRVYEWLLPTPLILQALILTGKLAGDPYSLVEAAIILPAGILLPILLFLWYRRGNREAGWLILPSLLPIATQVIFDVGFVAIYTGWNSLTFLDDPISFGPVAVQVADLGDFLFVLAIAIVMFFRFTRVSREKARAAAEFQAAREIQQTLVPASLPHVAGYALNAAYIPAEEVGGDFYQLLEQGSDGALIVLGDVSGKGLAAAMTVSAIIGSLRMMTACDPAEILHRLNDSLCGNVPGGFVTCLAAQLHPDGSCTLANAGHLPPWRNGEEVPLASGLPLGIAPGITYDATTLRLAPTDTLTLLSDGVVEARNPAGDLFGFDRTREISRQSAEDIARAAQQYGQQDDITVLTVSFTAVPFPA